MTPTSFIRAPHKLVADPHYSDASVLVYLALANHPGDVAGWIRKPQTHLARYLGWDDPTIDITSAVKRIQRALQSLVTDDWIQVRYRREGLHKVPLYRVPPRPAAEGWEAVPRSLFKTVTTHAWSKQGATLLRHWLYWRLSAGPAGWTAPNIARVARTFHVKTTTVSRRLKQLLEAGWLRRHDGIGGTALRFSETPENPTEEMPQAPAPSVQNIHACPDPEVSDTAPPKCPSGSTPAEDTPSNTRSVGASATTVQSPTRETTAAKPPTKKNRPTPKQRRGRNNDHFAKAAQHLVNTQTLLAHTPRLLRLMMINRLARQARLRHNRGEDTDWALLATHLHQRLEAATQDGTLSGNECTLALQALAGMRADTLAATSSQHRGTSLPPSNPAAEPNPAPTLDELRSRPHTPAPRLEGEIYDWAVWWLASAESDAIAKGRDPQESFHLAAQVLLEALRPHFQRADSDQQWTAWSTEASFAIELVKRSVDAYSSFDLAC